MSTHHECTCLQCCNTRTVQRSADVQPDFRPGDHVTMAGLTGIVTRVSPAELYLDGIKQPVHEDTYVWVRDVDGDETPWLPASLTLTQRRESPTPVAFEHCKGCLAGPLDAWQCPARGCKMLPETLHSDGRATDEACKACGRPT